MPRARQRGMLPIPITHKLLEFAIAFVLVVALTYWAGRPPGPRHRG